MPPVALTRSFPVPTALGFQWSPWFYGFLALVVLVSATTVYYAVKYLRHRRSMANDREDIESKLPNLPSPYLQGAPPTVIKFVDLEFGDELSRYPSPQTPCLSEPSLSASVKFVDNCRLLSPSDVTEDHFSFVCSLSASIAEWDLSSMGANLKSDDDTLSMPSLSMVEEDDEEHEGSVDITDRLHEYLSSSSTSLIALSKSECVLDVKFWDVCSSIPVISIEECEDPIPIDPNLKDTTLSAALSVTNLAMEFLPVPPPSFHAPQPKPAVISWSRVSGCTFTQPPPRPQRARPLLSNVLRANQDGFRRSTRPSRGKENTSPLGSLSSIYE